MTKTEYLEKMGYNPEKWTVLDKETSDLYKDLPGATNNIYPITQRKAVESFGKGYNLVSKEWILKHSKTENATKETSQATEVVASSVPPPPLPFKKEDSNSTSVIQENFNCEEENQTGKSSCETQCKDCQEFESTKISSDINLELRTKEVLDFGFKLKDAKFTHETTGLSFDCSLLEFANNATWEGNFESFKKTINEKVNEIKVVDFSEGKRVPTPEAVAVSKMKNEITKEMKTPVIAETSIEVKTKAVEPLNEIIVEAELIKDRGIESISYPNQFFSKLTSFGFQQLNLTINKMTNSKLNVIVKPQNFSGDPAFDEIKPLSLNGTAEELDKDFFKVISPALEKTSGLMSNAKSFIAELAEKEKLTKAKKAKGDALKKKVESAEKFYEKENFDFKKSGKTALRKFKDILEEDPKNKVCLDFVAKIEKSFEDLRKEEGEKLL